MLIKKKCILLVFFVKLIYYLTIRSNIIVKVSQKIVSICTLLDSKKASNIVVCDTTKKQNVVDYFIIATMDSCGHIKGVVDYIMEESLRMPLVYGEPKREGFSLSGWVVLDFDDVFVHLFTKEERDHYNLDKFVNEGGNMVSFKKIASDIKSQKEKEEAKAKSEMKRKLKEQSKVSKKTSKIKKEKAE